jgi:hypothetical protein
MILSLYGLAMLSRYILESLGVMDIISAETLARIPTTPLAELDALLDRDIRAAEMKLDKTQGGFIRLSKAVECMIKAGALKWDDSKNGRW